ncbi:AraC family transcriptional regulator [Peribacillus huizhouensis]|uniref:AraC-like DNA-binding protein n=1 Tax=Peribacillus huizhouensis TaxID=1501239 RepID=A0ABR6CM69_9BACI|nr:AraC family transcriptional regulator [Peribacillus huizhouensis]MBA9026125.1 AraC-like DNA-binding protein [Peribacillus huizhouensis]
MSEESKLFFKDFNKKCTILNVITKMDVQLIDQDGNPTLQLIHHHIPAVLQNFDNEYITINETMRQHEANSYYYYVNSFGLEYIAAGIWRSGILYGSVLIGPFISSIPSIGFVSDILSKNKLPVSERKQLEEFYTSLTVISSMDSTSIGDLLVNICTHEHIDSQLIASDIITPPLNKEKLKTNITESKTMIEARYQFEKRLMDAIARGDKEEIARIVKESNSLIHISDRIPESPIRSAKNMTLVMNTVCRKAAERGGVHPIYIHTISEKFAILIERAPNLPHLKKLTIVMLNEYCDLVQTFSTRNYSSHVKKAVEYIHLHLENPLTLHDLAATLHVNPSHLSRKFKAETTMNIIDYINQKRVEEAKLYLQRGNVSITEIAFMVGFNDLNYFSRVFKKMTSFTPSQYMKRFT